MITNFDEVDTSDESNITCINIMSCFIMSWSKLLKTKELDKIENILIMSMDVSTLYFYDF